MWNADLPMEWMDPMSWRLPSGKALAEFALQTGFLAPLILRAPSVKRKKPAQVVQVPPVETPGAVLEKELREGPEVSGTFRESR
jgi:hypothetical protein